MRAGKQVPFVFKCIVLICLRYTTGAICTVIGPALTDLTYYFNTTYGHIALAAALRGFGNIFGSLLGGYIVERKEKWAASLFTAIYGACIVLTSGSPFVPNVQMFCYIWAVIGGCLGFAYVVLLKYVSNLNPSDVNKHVQISSLFSLMGGITSPILVNPFLLDRVPAALEHDNFHRLTAKIILQNDTLFSPSNTTNFTLIDDVDVVTKDSTRVYVPFVVIGLVSLCAFTLWLLYLYLTGSCYTRNTETDDFESPEEKRQFLDSEPEEETKTETMDVCTSKQPSRSTKYIFIFVMSAYVFFMFSLYFIFSFFIRSFSADYFLVCRDTASLINTTFVIALMASSIMSFIMTRRLATKTAFIVCAVGQFTTVLAWAYFGKSSLTFHWVGSCAIAVFTIGPVNFSLSMVKECLSSDVFITVFICIRGLADLVLVWLTGHLYDWYGPQVLFVVLLSLGCLTIFFAILAFAISSCLAPKSQIRVFAPRTRHTKLR